MKNLPVFFLTGENLSANFVNNGVLGIISSNYRFYRKLLFRSNFRQTFISLCKHMIRNKCLCTPEQLTLLFLTSLSNLFVHNSATVLSSWYM